jgi:hypothetical protein
VIEPDRPPVGGYDEPTARSEQFGEQLATGSRAPFDSPSRAEVNAASRSAVDPASRAPFEGAS